MNLNEQAKHVHSLNKKWWTDLHTGEPIQRNKKELLALVISELIEALEAERKHLMDDKLVHRKGAEVEMADAYIRLLDYAGGFGLELTDEMGYPHFGDNKGESIFFIINDIVCATHADFLEVRPEQFWISCVIADIRAYCEKHSYDLDGAIQEKLVYNQSRKDHTHEARKQPGGKQF